jgi:hypothetical protein
VAEPFSEAWCDQCNAVLIEQGSEWNEVAERGAQVLAICAGCFADIRARNAGAPLASPGSGE